MTAEVAILNREAVAIAADSAVTVDGPEGRKIYNTANKLFALSTTEPIAVMVYGAGTFGSVPWETVVKKYRHQLTSEPYDTVAEYASDFIQYLSRFVKPGAHLERVRNTAYWELTEIRKSVRDRLLEMGIMSQRFGKRFICDEIITQIETRIGHLNSIGRIEELSETTAGHQVNLAVPDWKEFVGECLGDLPSNGRIQQYAKIMVRASLKVSSPFASGIVFAGFGKSQLFPSLIKYVVDGTGSRGVRSCCLDNIQIGEKGHTDEEPPAIIYPFAQTDMVDTFMGGIHPGYSLALEDFVDETIRLIIKHFEDHMQKFVAASNYSDVLDQVSNARPRIVDHFQSRLRRYLTEEYSNPIMSIVEFLPKEELAEMAESLVSLTSLRYRISTEDDTVGGPIDVAVISKGDGFIWIKRKHYFDPKLNLRYLQQNQRKD